MDYAGLKTPGVYINEISTLPASIVAVETAIPAFIGFAEKLLLNNENLLNDADKTPEYRRISSMKEYEDIFGGPFHSEVKVMTTIADKVSKVSDGAGGSREVLDQRTMTTIFTDKPKYMMHYQMQMFFANGGGPCYIVAVGGYNDAITRPTLEKGLEMLKTLDEPTLILFPDAHSLGADIYSLYEKALLQCEALKDRFVIMDVLPQSAAPAGKDAATFFRDSVNSPSLKYGAAYYPNLKTRLNYDVSKSNVTISHTRTITDRTLPIPVPPALPPAPAIVNGAFNGKKLAEISSGSEEYNQILAQLDTQRVELPPSCTIAGIYAAVDNARGVWKAPANVGVGNIAGLTVEMNDLDQQNFNVDATSGKSINVIRSFVGRGTVVWGARTLDGNNNEWRYIPVRRFFNMVEESVRKAMGFYVFEPNDANTWVKLKAGIENFLTLQWRAGALQGSKPEQAFFVSIGLGQTMSAFDILEGRLIIRIGMAVVRPAEFIILEFTHMLAQS